MAGVGVGGLITNAMMGNPDAQIANYLNGPNPSPMAQGGQGQPPGQQGGGGPAQPPPQPLAQAQVTQADPVNQPNIAALLMKAHERDLISADLNRNIAGMAASFGTASQQASKQANVRGMGGADDSLGEYSKIQGIMADQTAVNEAARFRAGAAGMATFLGTTPETAAWLAHDPKAMQEALATKFSNMTSTEAQKNVDAAAAAYAQANPQATPEEVAQFKSKMLVGVVPGPGQEQMKDAIASKDQAIEDYPNTNAKLMESQRVVDQLLKNKGATISAIKSITPTTGTWGMLNPLMLGHGDVKEQAVAMEKLKAILTGSSLSEVKNVRNRQEFNVLGQALTAAFDPANSPDKIEAALNQFRDKILDARAVSEAAAGHNLSGDLVGRQSARDFLDPENPYYTGAKEETPTVSSPDDISKLARGTPFIIPSGPHKGETGYAQ